MASKTFNFSFKMSDGTTKTVSTTQELMELGTPIEVDIGFQLSNGEIQSLHFQGYDCGYSKDFNFRFNYSDGSHEIKTISVPWCENVAPVVNTYYAGVHTIEVQPNQEITLDMYGAGAGGSGSVYSPNASPNGSDGGDVVLTYLSNTLIAGGGKHGTGGVWGNGSSFSNGTAGVGGSNTVSASASFAIQENQTGNDAVIGSRFSPQLGGAAIASSIGAMNGGGNGATGVGDESWSFGGGGGSGGRLKVKFTNTTGAVITFNLNVGAQGQGWKSGGNPGTDGGIGFAIVTTIGGGS